MRTTTGVAIAFVLVIVALAVTGGLLFAYGYNWSAAACGFATMVIRMRGVNDGPGGDRAEIDLSIWRQKYINPDCPWNDERRKG